MNIAYAAGLFDGEGMVRIARWAKPNSAHIRYQVIVMVGMTHKPVIEALAKSFGGSVHCNDHSKRNPNARPQWCWYISSQVAKDFLTRIRPYLVVKSEEVTLALSLQRHIDKYKFKLGNRFALHQNHEKLIAFRESVYRQISSLKRPHRTQPVKSDPKTQ